MEPDTEIQQLLPEVWIPAGGLTQQGDRFVGPLQLHQQQGLQTLEAAVAGLQGQGPLQGRQRRWIVLELVQHDGEIAPAIGAVGIQAHGPLQPGARLVGSAEVGKHGAEVDQRLSMVGIDPQGGVQQRQGRLKIAATGLDQSQSLQGIGIGGTLVQPLAQARFSQLQVTVVEGAPGDAERRVHNGCCRLALSSSRWGSCRASSTARRSISSGQSPARC